jgi:hypothetical protein
MDASTLIALGAVATAFVGSLLTFRSARAATSVGRDANRIQWVEQARKDATQAQQRAGVAEAKAEDAERRADGLQERLRRMEIRMVDLESRERYIEARARHIVRMIHDPYMSIDMLRERVPADFAVGPDSP